jgi:hypothetical protein
MKRFVAQILPTQQAWNQSTVNGKFGKKGRAAVS